MHLAIVLHFGLSIIFMLIFLTGYFPVQKNIYKAMEPPDLKLQSINLNQEQFYGAQIDKLVFIIIDALRYDFVTLQNMPFTYNQMHCLTKVKVESPTVTLPRIKSLTTGTVPQFIDIVLNLGASAKCEDSFLHRAHKVHKQMIFYGDDTWLKMFPDLFKRSEGTTSFFVNDFIEVDDNVTRHLNAELNQSDWDMMFLHYLGLDHIGHVRGPFSSLIKSKLQEMDNVIKKIISSVEKSTKRTLVLISGDHGMKDSGGHGGTTYAETHVPLITYTNKGNLHCDKSNAIIAQSDIATTISLLFGIEIPANSVGKLIPSLFVQNITQLLYMGYYNAKVLSERSKCCDDILQKAFDLHEDYLKTLDENKAKLAFHHYQTCLHKMSIDLIRSLIKQDVNYLLIGILGTIYSLINIIEENSQLKRLILPSIILIIFFACNYFNYCLANSPLIVTLLLLVLYKLPKLFKYLWNDLGGLLTMFLLIHVCLLQSSSFIEEEHQIYYYFLGNVSILIAYASSRHQKSMRMVKFVNTLSIIALLRLLRTINSTGDQWASYPDLADWLLREKNQFYLITLHAMSLIGTYFTLQKMPCQKLGHLMHVFVLSVIFIYKNFYENHYVAKIIWFSIFSQFILSRGINLLNTWILVINLLLRPYNSILVPTCYFCSIIIRKHVKTFNLVSMFHHWLGYTFFFCQAHSNSIASIDLAPGYIGLTAYEPVIVLLLTLCHTYSFPTMVIIQLLTNSRSIFPKVIIVYRLFILLTIYLVVFIQRGHLFVWSVFAPKLLIEAVHIVVLFIQVLLSYLINNKTYLGF